MPVGRHLLWQVLTIRITTSYGARRQKKCHLFPTCLFLSKQFDCPYKYANGKVLAQLQYKTQKEFYSC